MYIYLDIVEQFSCEMCGTCCRNDWQVTVDEASYRRNLALCSKQGSSAEFYQAFVPIKGDRKPGEYAYIAKGPSGGCWFLEDTNLCRLHRQAGHNQLDTVCQTFPRYPMVSARGIELTLSFSCPAVLRLAERSEPLQVVRSDRPPIDFLPDSWVEHIYPQQKQPGDPLRYYFEIEQHLIDILQCRGLLLAERLQMIEQTGRQLCGVAGQLELGSPLNRIFYNNYECMDAAADREQLNQAGQDILIEHFFVNFIFKKPVYSYGFSKAVNWLNNFFCYINQAVALAWPGTELDCVKAAIMELELRYGHNRKLLESM